MVVFHIFDFSVQSKWSWKDVSSFCSCNVSSYVVNPIASKSQAAHVSLQDFLTQLHSGYIFEKIKRIQKS